MSNKDTKDYGNEAPVLTRVRVTGHTKKRTSVFATPLSAWPEEQRGEPDRWDDAIVPLGTIRNHYGNEFKPQVGQKLWVFATWDPTQNRMLVLDTYAGSKKPAFTDIVEPGDEIVITVERIYNGVGISMPNMAFGSGFFDSNGHPARARYATVGVHFSAVTNAERFSFLQRDRFKVTVVPNEKGPRAETATLISRQ